MALWDKLFNKGKPEGPSRLNPIVQRSPAPAPAPRVSNAKPVPKPAPPMVEQKTEPLMPKPERETKSRKKAEGGTKMRAKPGEDQTMIKRGLHCQSQGDHDGAIEAFTKAIEMNPNFAQAYASRGVSREAKGDGQGAKSDYSKSIQLEIMGEINRQMRENPEVEM